MCQRLAGHATASQEELQSGNMLALARRSAQPHQNRRHQNQPGLHRK